MRRLFVVITAVVLTGVGLAAWGTVASAREAGPSELERAQQKLPPLPANIKSRTRFNIAVKCDTPPFGYIGARSQNAGFDVEIARYFSRFAFGKGNRVTLSCVTTPSREPALTTDRVDLVIATFTYNTDRDTRIDFSRAYYKATGRLLVRNNGSPPVPLGTWPGRPSPRPAAPSTTGGSRTVTRTRSSSSPTASRTRSWLFGTAGPTG